MEINDYEEASLPKTHKEVKVAWSESLMKTRIKTITLIKNLAKETIGNETSQAIIRIFETKYLSLKIFWLLCLLGCGSLCFYLVAQTFLLYFSYSVYTNRTIVNEIPSVFPKITVCNSMPAITEYAFDLIKEINDVNYPDTSIFNQTQMDELSFREAGWLFWDIWKIFMGKINSVTFSDFERNKLVHSLDDTLWSCTFYGQPCPPSDFTWHWNPFYGNCYVFNSRLNESGDAVGFKNSSLSDNQFGLILSIYVGYNDKLNLFNAGWNNLFSFTNSYGLNVMIENNTYLSAGNTNSIALNGGTLNFISMKREFSSKLPKPYSNCDIDNSNPGKIDSYYYNLISQSPYQYSQELCVVQCMQQQAIKLCNCSIPIYLDIYNVSCTNEGESNCAMKLPYDGEFSSIIPDCIPKCPLECNSTDISYTMTSQSISGVGFIKLIEENPTFLSDFNSTQLTVESTSNKFVQLYAYYDSLKYASSTDSPSMDIVMLLGNIGGTLGLFLGVSLLSVCEFVHVMIESCLIVKHRFRTKKQLSTIKK